MRRFCMRYLLAPTDETLGHGGFRFVGDRIGALPLEAQEFLSTVEIEPRRQRKWRGCARVRARETEQQRASLALDTSYGRRSVIWNNARYIFPRTIMGVSMNRRGFFSMETRVFSMSNNSRQLQLLFRMFRGFIVDYWNRYLGGDGVSIAVEEEKLLLRFTVTGVFFVRFNKPKYHSMNVDIPRFNEWFFLQEWFRRFETFSE